MTLAGRAATCAACIAALTMASRAIATESPDDHSGRYYVAIGHSPRFTMELVQTGTAVEFTLTGKNLDIQGTGTVHDSAMTLTADLGETGAFSATVTFWADATGFTGAWEVDGPNPIEGTITGTTSPWATYDIDAHGVPQLAVAGCIELVKIDRVSRFRSGEGHDYSDELESCRSMKHYFDPKPDVRRNTVRLFSPVTGTVIGTTDEWDGPTLWKGKVIGIRPDSWPAFDVVIFHVDPRRTLNVGSLVAAGEELGTSEKTSGTVADIAVGVHTPAGYRLVSIFEAMTDAVFWPYVELGAAARTDFIIPRAERDANPLSCVGEQFVDPGQLENWVDLLDNPTPRRVRARRPLPR